MIKVLILEDDLVDQMALKRLFRKKISHAEWTICATCKSANEYLSKENFDWVISDFNLPDGTLQDILCFAKKNKMICVSGELEDEKLLELKAAGLHKYLLKDQQLKYLDAIYAEITNSPEEQVEIKTALAPELDHLQQQLSRHFDDDEQAKKEVIEIFHDQIMGSDIPLLMNSIRFKDGKKLNHLAHKIQSSFRLFNDQEILEHLRHLEEWADQSTIDWKKIQDLQIPLKNHFNDYSIKVGVLLQHLKKASA